MQSSTTAGAERSEAARRLRSADCDAIGTVLPPSMAARLVAGAANLIRGLARLLAGRRRRRRPRLQGWTTMDPRVLADIGVTRADVQAVLYAGVPIERLGARPASRSVCAVVAKPCRRAPCLRLAVADDLDRAA
jgi:uncharacterized protein YjiS (DUF1127 family)